MSGDSNIYGGFVSGSGGTAEAVWGKITGNIKSQTDLVAELDKKVNKQQGKGLSSNDFTDEEQEKLSKLNTIFTFSLLPDSWELFNDNIYTQTVALENIKSTDTVIADICLDDNEETSKKEIEYWSNISKIEVKDGSITAYYQGEIPASVLNVKIKI